MAEIWKWVEGYEKLYKISNYGNVISVPRNTTKGGKLNLVRNSAGYNQVSLSKKGKIKIFLVHRLVSNAFIPNPCGFPIINHIDENKLNNCISNLEWCTSEYNFAYGTSLKRRARTQGKPIEGTHVKTGGKVYFESAMEAGRNGFSQPSISNCCRGVQDEHMNYTWRFINKEVFEGWEQHYTTYQNATKIF